MKKLFIILFISILIIGCKKQKPTETNKELITVITKTIDSLFTIDQKVQTDMIKAYKNGDSEKGKKLYKIELATFKRHTHLLKNIIAEIGYPTTEIIGKETSHQFFVMIQHSDADVAFQKKMLNTISKEVKKGNIAAKDFALLTDRVMLALQKPQVYGTQVKYTEKGQAIPKNLKDSINVNQRRKKLGIETIEEYLNRATKMHFLMNKTRYEKKGIMEPQIYKLK